MFRLHSLLCYVCQFSTQFIQVNLLSGYAGETRQDFISVILSAVKAPVDGGLDPASQW
jgi:hypothetical protein